MKWLETRNSTLVEHAFHCLSAELARERHLLDRHPVGVRNLGPALEAFVIARTSAARLLPAQPVPNEELEVPVERCQGGAA